LTAAGAGIAGPAHVRHRIYIATVFKWVENVCNVKWVENVCDVTVTYWVRVLTAHGQGLKDKVMQAAAVDDLHYDAGL
jgi:hypothetical protein